MSDEPSKAALKQDIDALRNLVLQQNEQIADLKAEVQMLRDNDESQSSRISSLEDANELVVDVKQNASGDYAQYAAIILRSLLRQAKDNTTERSHLKAGQPTVDALQGRIKRPNTYDLLREVETLADSPAVMFDEDATPMRLVVDLSEGDVPASIEGHKIKSISAGVSA